MRHIIPISGKDSAATAIIQTVLDPNLEYEYVFNPTEIELPPVHEWIEKVSAYLGKPIQYIGRNFIEVVELQKILPSPQVRYCTKYCKIYPLENFLDGKPSFVYYGLRADEQYRQGYENKSKKGKGGSIQAKYPLRETGAGLPMVWTLLEKHDLLPPYFPWQEIIDRVKSKMGDDFRIISKLKPWHYTDLFSWRARPLNCAYCIFMRQYEVVGLSEHYPEIFQEAVDLEQRIGAEGFTFIRGSSLDEIASRAKQIKEKRAKHISKLLYGLAQKNMFEFHNDLLSTTSCGLFCGK